MRGKRVGRHFCKFRHGITPAGAGKTHMPSGLSEIFQDHPRRCGENIISQPFLQCKVGSPPQVRGKLVGSVFNDGVYRITPAGAGKTSFPAKDTARIQDHPRRCGENRTDCYDVRLRKGSPPQVRGKLCVKYLHSLQCGITPAGAGKTRRWYIPPL